ncbi:MAG: 4-hydroxy-tetrahydrodipicolinate reductase [Bacteroidales bacterium OttesenSCG-928-I14]|jgi:4-hydroxy-tetrahydrodipicolinate reductase|nr:4-hydroxy-tetrahydrodipicolinate reductase [Bacteroidales bacterium OttesenSCG-928-I14]
MNIALIGYGKMGHEIEKIALERGHCITSIIDTKNQRDFNSDNFIHYTDVAIEFTCPKSAFNNYMKCFERNIPVVTGTTGWLQNIWKIKKECLENKRTFFYASNYSIGVNLFFAVNKFFAKLMNTFNQYDVLVEEVHHIQKLDTPSGTAITLAEGIVKNIERKSFSNLPIRSKRIGKFPGIHTVIYESESDIITIRHNAKNRRGFAFGAILAAEYTQKKTGFLSMDDLLKL